MNFSSAKVTIGLYLAYVDEGTRDTLGEFHNCILFDYNFLSVARPLPTDTRDFEIRPDDRNRTFGVAPVFLQTQRALGAIHRKL